MDHSQEDTLETVDLTVSGSTLKSPLDTSTTLVPSEDEHEEPQNGLDLPDDDVDLTAQKDDLSSLVNQSQTRGMRQNPEMTRGKSISRSEGITSEVNEPSSSTQPSRPKIPYLKQDDSYSATRPGNLDTRREREADNEEPKKRSRSCWHAKLSFNRRILTISASLMPVSLPFFPQLAQEEG